MLAATLFGLGGREGGRERGREGGREGRREGGRTDGQGTRVRFRIMVRFRFKVSVRVSVNDSWNNKHVSNLLPLCVTDSSDIVDHKLKLILGLIWTLILHYSISMPMWEGEDEEPQKPDTTPKQRLLGWIQSKVPDRPVKNFTSDWNDGKMIGALVDAIAPGESDF